MNTNTLSFFSFFFLFLCGLGLYFTYVLLFAHLPPRPPFLSPPPHTQSNISHLQLFSPALCCSLSLSSAAVANFFSLFSFSFSLFSLKISSSAFHLASASGILWRLRASSGVKIVNCFFQMF